MSLTETQKKKAEALIYDMQKKCATVSWAGFISECGLDEDEDDLLFKEIADRLGLDGSKFYFKV